MNLQNLQNMLQDYIIDEVSIILILVNNIKYMLAWKFTAHFEFFCKIATWDNNGSIISHPKAKFINNIWRLKISSQNLSYLLENLS